MNEVERDRIFYDHAYEYLLDIAPNGLDENSIERGYLTVDKSRYSTLDEIFDRMISSVVNRQSMPNVIGYGEKNRSVILDVLGGPSVELVARMNQETLYDEFYKRIGFKNYESKRNSWRLFSRSVVDCAKFLEPFGEGPDFYAFADEFIESPSVSAKALPYLRLTLPVMIQQKVYGMGFALACDFLKEIGYDCYPKPDVHLTRIFTSLGLARDDSQYTVYEAIVRASYNASISLDETITAYRLDKIVFLISSGKFYGFEGWKGKEIGPHWSQFIEYMKSILKNAG